MMKSGRDPLMWKRANMFKLYLDLGISSSTMGALTGLFVGLTEEEKEELAEQLSKLLERSNSEKDFLEKVVKSFGKNIVPKAVKLLETMK